MTGFLRDAGLASQIVAIAYVALVGGGVVLAMASSLLGRLLGKRKSVTNPLEALIGIGVIVGIPAAFAAAAALFVTPLLVAMPLPLAGWLMIAAFSFYGFWGSEHGGGEMGGCTKMIGVSISAYGLAWALTAIVLADPPASNLGGVLRPILLAAPLAFVLGKGNKQGRVKMTIGFTLMFALLLGLAFLPVENGSAAHLLPASDWLRFPIAGAVVFAVWPLLAIPLSLLFSKRAVDFTKLSRTMAVLALLGAAFGLVWAATRLVF